MNQLEQLARDVRMFATEGCGGAATASVANGHENEFLELSERMARRAEHGCRDRPR